MRGREPDRKGREALTNGIHLAVLSALALAQPVFDILGRNPTFFAVRDSSSTEIVLFAVALAVLPPIVLVLVELAVAAVSRGFARALHFIFLGALVALLALAVITKVDALTGSAALVVALAAGTGAALVYARTQAARSFLTVLAPAPLLFLALFLFQSPVSKLVFVDTPEVQAVTVSARTPVVLIVFDEFSTVGLMNQRQRIDAARFPNFGSLAADSTWFRNATTKYWLSEVAVPSLLTGRLPVPGRLPVFSEYPRNVFTLLGGSYRVVAIETLTRLCPPTICRQARASQAGAQATGAYGSLASDVGIVYLHLLLPAPYASRLPHIDDSWGDFGAREDRAQTVGPSGTIEPCARNVCRFTNSITADRGPTFYFLHSLLPHVPYLYLPSGRRYAIDARVLRGMERGVWKQSWPSLQSYQRYLLQVAYTDRALGNIVRRLRSTGLYKNALVIVTADHGVSFRLEEPRRRPTPGNLDDIAFVPLFVKLPGQTRGRILDSPVSTIDVVPSIARVVGISVPWRLDGRPVVGRRLPTDGTVSVLAQEGRWITAPLAELRAQRARTLERQLAVFGSGSLSALYRIGPHHRLVGRTVAGLRVRPSVDGTDELDGRMLLGAVDRDSDLLPSYIEGKIKGSVTRDQALAVAVNGRIAATTRTFVENGEMRFSASVPENALHAGENAVAVYAVRGNEPRLVLEQLRDSDRGFTLEERDGREVIESAGRTLAIRPGALRGTVRVASKSTGFAFTGNAKHVKARRPIHTLVVFVEGRGVYWGRSEDLRPHHILGQAREREDAFVFELPRSLLPPRGRDNEVRVFAVRLGIASELRYVGEWFWATH
ncbi:MAG: sulfatase-like hydrolase/transferase [Thermoleophilia bacterium]